MLFIFVLLLLIMTSCYVNSKYNSKIMIFRFYVQIVSIYSSEINILISNYKACRSLVQSVVTNNIGVFKMHCLALATL